MFHSDLLTNTIYRFKHVLRYFKIQIVGTLIDYVLHIMQNYFPNYNIYFYWLKK